MVHLITVIRAVDQITDIIPVIGNVKNFGIYLYQLSHKVDETCNPVTTGTVSWTHDFQINALAKNLEILNLIPILGEISFIYRYLQKLYISCYLNEPTDTLSDIIRENRSPRHYEVLLLELARRPKKILDIKFNDFLFESDPKNYPPPTTLYLLSGAPNIDILEQILWSAEDLKADAETAALSLSCLFDYLKSRCQQAWVLDLMLRLKRKRPDLIVPIIKKGLERKRFVEETDNQEGSYFINESLFRIILRDEENKLDEKDKIELGNLLNLEFPPLRYTHHIKFIP